MAAILGLFLVYLAFHRIRARPQHSQSPLLDTGTSRVPRVDIEGWALQFLALTIPFIALSLGDNTLNWTSPLEILLLLSVPVLLALFVLYETKVAVEPVINMEPLFKIQYLRVLLQVFGVALVFNAVWNSHFPELQYANNIARSSSFYLRTFKFAISMTIHLKIGQ